MSIVVIDTNVLLVADGKHPDMGDNCRNECVERLQRIRDGERVLLDLQWVLLGEYGNKLKPNGPPTPGNAFLKWLYQVQADERHVVAINLTRMDKYDYDFVEFPADEKLRVLVDKSDRKFIAAANAHPDKPPILESADSKWLAWEPQLAAVGIRLEVLCRAKLEEIRKRKGF